MPLTDDFMLPRRVRTMEQMADLLQAEEAEIDQAQRTIDSMAAQLAINSSTFLLPRHERIFGLVTNTEESLEVRRARVLARLNTRGVTTVQAVRELVQIITGREGEVSEHFGDYAFSVAVRLLFQDSTESLGELIRQIDEIKPAHLVFDTIGRIEPVVLENRQQFFFAALTTTLRQQTKPGGLGVSRLVLPCRAWTETAAALSDLAVSVRQQERQSFSVGGFYCARKPNVQGMGFQKIRIRSRAVTQGTAGASMVQSNTQWRFNGQQPFSGRKKFNGGIKRSEL